MLTRIEYFKETLRISTIQQIQKELDKTMDLLKIAIDNRRDQTYIKYLEDKRDALIEFKEYIESFF